MVATVNLSVGYVGVVYDLRWKREVRSPVRDDSNDERQ